MLPPALDMLMRAVSLVVAVTLAVSPWIIAVDVNDPFLNQSWIIFGQAFICLAVLGIIRLRFQPRRSQFPLLASGLLAWLALAGSTLNSSYLVSLRTGLLWSSLLLILFALRATFRDRDAAPLLVLISSCGLLMGIYALFQAFGHDFLTWPWSEYRVVGTLSNPQFLSAYLMTTALVTVGLCLDPALWSPGRRLTLLLSAIVQIAGMLATGMASCQIGLAFGITMFFTTFWESRPGRLLRSTPLLAGSITTIILLTVYATISLGVASYPWSRLAKTSTDNVSAISRLFEWSMGFSLFSHHPLTGIGPGAAQYQLSAFRPQLGTALGLSSFNDDPHAWPIQLLGETGLGGLFAACTMFAALLGVHARRRHHAPVAEDAAADAEEAATGNPPPETTAPPCRPPSTPTPTATGPRYSLARAALVPAISLIFYGLFNSALSITPLLTQVVLLVGLHQALCLRNIRWRRGFSFAAIAYLLVLPAFSVSAWVCQSSHHAVERQMFAGMRMLEADRLEAAETAFTAALQHNPQYLLALRGLALSHERQNRRQRTMEILARLDALSPNAFFATYEIARLAFDSRLLLEAHRSALLNLSRNQNPRSYELLGRILLSEGRQVEAEQAFREGLRLIPEWQNEEVESAGRIRLYLAEILTENGDWKEAESLLSALPDELASSPNVHYLRGLTLYKAGKATDALALFELALASDTASEPKYLNALGYLLAETNGDLDRAENLLEDAYRIYRSRQHPLLTDILQVTHSLGIVAWKKGQKKRAGDLLQIVAEQSPPDWGAITAERQADWQRFQTGGPPERPLQSTATTFVNPASATGTP